MPTAKNHECSRIELNWTMVRLVETNEDADGGCARQQFFFFFLDLNEVGRFDLIQRFGWSDQVAQVWENETGYSTHQHRSWNSRPTANCLSACIG